MKRKNPWTVSDALWSQIEPLIPNREELRDPDKVYLRRTGGGRKAKYNNRTILSAILYIFRTGIQWRAIPREHFGGLSSTTVFERFQQWEKAGFFSRVWEAGLTEYDKFKGINWNIQPTADDQSEAPRDAVEKVVSGKSTASGKTKSKSVKPNERQRKTAKRGNKRR